MDASFLPAGEESPPGDVCASGGMETDERRLGNVTNRLGAVSLGTGEASEGSILTLWMHDVFHIGADGVSFLEKRGQGAFYRDSDRKNVEEGRIIC